jgi:hypothetical protein
MRLIVAALIGGIVLFTWGFVSHMLLPVGELGLRTLPIAQQDAAIAGLKAGMTEPGIYMLPTLENMEDYGDQAKMDALGERMKTNPYAFVAYSPDPNPAGTSMGPQLATEFATNVVSALIAAFIVGFAAVGYGTRVLLFTALGVFTFVTAHVPYWNWYRFPTDFTMGAAVGHVVGWFLAGLAMAWWLARARR